MAQNQNLYCGVVLVSFRQFTFYFFLFLEIVLLLQIRELLKDSGD